MAPSTPGGLYAHIPFCRRKCAYCDFYSITDLGLKTAFLDALAREIAVADPLPLVFDTIHIGGGTPSVLEPAEVGGILDALAAKFPLVEPVEITIEANPGTLNAAKLAGYRRVGVNRLNIGVQSFRSHPLEFLGRIHTASEAGQTIEWARAAGFDNLGIDLIYGLPGQSRRDWRQDLSRAVAFAPEHIACYMLSVEPGTPLADRLEAGRFKPAADSRAAELFLLTSEFLEERNFLHYEISNFARRGAAGGAARVSRHNSKYWSYAPYLGFGPAAHSFVPPLRFWNLRDVGGYVARAGEGLKPLEGDEVLDARQQMTEFIMLALRTSAGVDLGEFQRRFELDFLRAFGTVAEALAGQGLITMDGRRLAPTRRGMLYHDSVVAALTDFGPEN
jgi:oxygen-independent coproporphyrinogen-3 oxidase